MFSVQKFALLLFIAFLAGQPDNLRRYTECGLGQFRVVESSERGQPFVRTVHTASGDQQVEVVHGISLHIAYHETPFVNFKAEKLGRGYPSSKQVLLANLKYLTADPGMETAEPLHSSLNGFDVYGINRKQLEGGVISIYELFRDADQTVVTVYLLNTPPESPQFRTMDQYRVLRDEFLSMYTKCAGAASKTAENSSSTGC